MKELVLVDWVQERPEHIPNNLIHFVIIYEREPVISELGSMLDIERKENEILLKKSVQSWEGGSVRKVPSV